jgi:hypothetical protein
MEDLSKMSMIQSLVIPPLNTTDLYPFRMKNNLYLKFQKSTQTLQKRWTSLKQKYPLLSSNLYDKIGKVRNLNLLEKEEKTELEQFCKQYLMDDIRVGHAILCMRDIGREDNEFSEVSWRVNLWSSLVDFFLKGFLQVIVRREEIAFTTSATRKVTKIPDLQVVSKQKISSMQTKSVFLLMEEKAPLIRESADYRYNTIKGDIPVSAYKNNKADRLKLARMMRDSLMARNAGKKEIVYGIQWIGKEMWIFSMNRFHADYTLLTQLYEVDLEVEGKGPELFQAMRILRDQIQEEWELDMNDNRDSTEAPRRPLKITPQTPKKGNPPNQPGKNPSSKDSKSRRQNKSPSSNERLDPSEMIFCPPVRLNPQDHPLPSNGGRYCIQNRYYRSPQSQLWEAKRVFDGLPVILKRIWKDPRESLHELSMHIAATSQIVRGIVPLLDCFWDRPASELGGGAYLVLVFPPFYPFIEYITSVHLSIPQICKLSLDLLQILKDLHLKANLVHLDIKPDNLLISLPSKKTKKKRRLFLTDFGLAHPRGTKLRGPMGTKGFMAPEVEFLSEDTDLLADSSQDMWSFGALLSHLLERATDSHLGLVELARMCQHIDPTNRPDATQAISLLSSILLSSGPYHKPNTKSK